MASKVKGMVETLEKRHLDKISNVEVSVDRFGKIQNNNNVLPKNGNAKKVFTIEQHFSESGRN